MLMECLGTTPVASAVIVAYLDGVVVLVEDLAWLGIRRIVDQTDCDLAGL